MSAMFCCLCIVRYIVRLYTMSAFHENVIISTSSPTSHWNAFINSVTIGCRWTCTYNSFMKRCPYVQMQSLLQDIPKHLIPVRFLTLLPANFEKVIISLTNTHKLVADYCAGIVYIFGQVQVNACTDGSIIRNIICMPASNDQRGVSQRS